ncbi:MAG: hypothetical protein GY928_18830 [Colwellia sp.]|nr:hypothetical protein [Colwellia sp.]
MKKKAIKQSRGSFCIPVQAINILLETGKAAKWLIPSYLKIAAHTDATGMYSTAGRTSIRRTLRRNKPDVMCWIEQLCELGLIYTAEQWTGSTGETFPEVKSDRMQIRHVVELFNEDKGDMVWFGRNLVDGIGQFRNPLRSLADCGADAARMFLYFHREYDNQVFHAFNPLTTIYRGYCPVGRYSATNHMINQWGSRGDCLVGSVLTNVFPEHEFWSEFKDDEQWQDKEMHWDAVNNLKSEGLIYEVASVISSPVKKSGEKADGSYDWDYVDLSSAGVVYELANLGQFNVGTGKLHDSIREVVKQLTSELISADAMAGLFSILKTGSNNSVIGLYKPRFGVTNKRNAYVAEGLGNIKEDKEQPKQWLQHFINTKGLNAEDDEGKESDNVTPLF